VFNARILYFRHFRHKINTLSYKNVYVNLTGFLHTIFHYEKKKKFNSKSCECASHGLIFEAQSKTTSGKLQAASGKWSVGATT